MYKDGNSKYCYSNSNTLINKLNIKNEKTLQKYEAKITAAKLLDLRQKGITGNFSANHFVSIHNYLFEDIYPFAGKFRTEDISKGAFTFAHWEYIEEQLNYILNKLKEESYLIGLSKEEYAIKLTYYISELNVLHPFREGNGRTIREFARQLSLKNKYVLNFTKCSPINILEASKRSVVDPKELENLILCCLDNI